MMNLQIGIRRFLDDKIGLAQLVNAPRDIDVQVGSIRLPGDMDNEGRRSADDVDLKISILSEPSQVPGPVASPGEASVCT